MMPKEPHPIDEVRITKARRAIMCLELPILSRISYFSASARAIAMVVADCIDHDEVSVSTEDRVNEREAKLKAEGRV